MTDVNENLPEVDYEKLSTPLSTMETIEI